MASMASARVTSWSRLSMVLVRRSFQHSATRLQLKGHFDFKAICEEAAIWEDIVAKRKSNANVSAIIRLYDQFRHKSSEVMRIRSHRNELASRASVLIPQTKLADESAATLASATLHDITEEGKQLKSKLAIIEAELATISTELNAEAFRLPNRLHSNVPFQAPQLIRTFGTQPPPETTPLDHVALGERHRMFDFERAAKTSGSSFYFLTGAAALLEMALVQFALHRCAAKGFTPILTPDIVHRDLAEGCGYQPRGEVSQLYGIEPTPENLNAPKLCLIGTSEIPLAGMYSNQILAADTLPLRMVAFSHCFRRETGHHGTENKGLYRVHQFSKVEMFAITNPEASEQALEDIVALQQELFADLGLHFVVLDMPADDLGASAYRKFDIEAYMPGRRGFGEISSASNCTDYQSRRLNIRFRRHPNSPPEFVHTINGTALAIPRIIISILETHQQPDGSIVLPQPLHPFLGGLPPILKPYH